MAATWQEPLLKGGYSGRYQIFNEGPEDGDEDWILKDNKRRRRSTGGTFNKNSKDSQNMPEKMSTHEFKAMSTDEKLVKLFELMTTTNAMNARVISLENNVQNINKHVSTNSDRLKLLEYKSIDSEARNRRNNLVFRGIAETSIDDGEESERLIVNFLRDHLQLYTDIVIQRAHRLGQRRRNYRGRTGPPTPRPIIVCFRDYKDVEMIIGAANKLKNTPYGINKDFPKEITSARSQLWPIYKTERAKNPDSSVYIGFPAKLVVRGRVIKDLFPDWFTVLRGSRCETTDGQKDQQYAQREQRPNYSHDTARPCSAPLAPAPALIPENDQQADPDQSDTDSDPESTPEPNSLMDTSNADKETAETSVYDSAMNHLSSHADRIIMSQTSIQPKPQRAPRSSSVPRSRDKLVEQRAPVQISNKQWAPREAVTESNYEINCSPNKNFEVNIPSISLFRDTITYEQHDDGMDSDTPKSNINTTKSKSSNNCSKPASLKTRLKISESENNMTRLNNEDTGNNDRPIPSDTSSPSDPCNIINSTLSVASLNVCGLKRRVQYPDFISFVNQYNVVCLAETKLDEADIILLDGYTFISQPRRQKYLRKSGGIGFFVRNNLSKHVKTSTMQSEYIACINISRNYHKHDQDILIASVYIPLDWLPSSNLIMHTQKYFCYWFLNLMMAEFDDWYYK